MAILGSTIDKKVVNAAKKLVIKTLHCWSMLDSHVGATKQDQIGFYLCETKGWIELITGTSLLSNKSIKSKCN